MAHQKQIVIIKIANIEVITFPLHFTLNKGTYPFFIIPVTNQKCCDVNTIHFVRPFKYHSETQFIGVKQI